MIDQACIFTTGGVQLFYKAFCDLKLDFINQFIKKTMVHQKFDNQSIKLNGQVFNYRISQDLGLIFQVVYQELFQNPFSDQFIDLIQKEFSGRYLKEAYLKNGMVFYCPDFETHFTKLLNAWEKKQQQQTQLKDNKPANRNVSSKEPKREEDTRLLAQNTSSSEKPENLIESQMVSSEVQPEQSLTSEQFENLKLERQYSESAKVEPVTNTLTAKEKIELKKKQMKSQRPQPDSQKVQQESEPLNIYEELARKEKESKNKSKSGRTWDVDKSANSKRMKDLDRSKRMENQNPSLRSNDSDFQAAINKEYFEDDGKAELEASFEQPSDDEDSKKNEKTKTGGLLSRFTDTLKNFTGNKVLDQKDLTPVLIKFKEDLMTKNVAEPIANQICESIKSKLINHKTESFTSITKTVKRAMEEILTKILTPKTHIDIISEALKQREKGKPYVCVFIGVNGVGKSTNLAKIAYQFKSHGFSVMLAACDNFRSGAVEQIMTHGRCLDIPVFQRGYKDDPAIIAHDAVREATSRKIDVVLIDTAGRMQDNEPLMKSLSRLVNLNQPNLITFIGEALVGNDGVDQLMKFNQALLEMAPDNTNPREIDAILISKFDTVDEKGKFFFEVKKQLVLQFR